ncbi:MAG: GAF domain-containing protein [Candidatus Nanopelagicales bacterium]
MNTRLTEVRPRTRLAPTRIYNQRNGWTATDRLAASNKLRSALDAQTGLRAVVEAAAETICELLATKSVSLVLLDDRGYRDLVNVGYLAPGEVRFPEDEGNAAGSYPASTTRLLAGQAYVTIGSCLQLLDEYQNLAPGQSIGAVMGLPILHDDVVWGEVFLIRDIEAPGFNNDDLQVAYALATEFGLRLPVLLEV